MDKKEIDIQQTKHNFTGFKDIIHHIVDEILYSTKKLDNFEVEKQLLEIITQGYSSNNNNTISDTVFYQEQINDYITNDITLTSYFYPLLVEGISQGLLNYLKDFNRVTIDNQPQHFHLMGSTLARIEQILYKNIRSIPLSVSEHIDKIDTELLNEFIPEKLESKLTTWGISKSHINTINAGREKTTRDEVRAYIDNILCIPQGEEDYINNIFSIENRNNLLSGVVFICITKKNTIVYIIKDPSNEYFQQNLIQLQKNHKKVFLLKKPPS